MGLSLAGILRIPILERTWRPLDAGASASLTTMTGGMTLAPAGGGGDGAARVGSRLVGGRAGLGTAFALGAIFAIGWTPCIGVILGGILTLAATADGRLQGALLLVGYTLGLGIPFIIIAAFYDRSQRMVRFLVKHGRAVSMVGGLLVAAIGFAMIFDSPDPAAAVLPLHVVRMSDPIESAAPHRAAARPARRSSARSPGATSSRRWA